MVYYRSLLALLITAAGASGAWADRSPLLLTCNGEPKTDPAIVAALCDALAHELEQHKPKRVFRRRAAPDPLPRRAWDVVLEVTLTENYHWKARLAWARTGRKGAGKRTTGPDIEAFGMDAPLGPETCSRFVRSLLKVSRPAFLASPRGVEPLSPP